MRDYHYVLTLQAEREHGDAGRLSGTSRGVYTAARAQTRSDIFNYLYDRLMTSFPPGYGNPVTLFWSLEPEKL